MIGFMTLLPFFILLATYTWWMRSFARYRDSKENGILNLNVGGRGENLINIPKLFGGYIIYMYLCTPI